MTRASPVRSAPPRLRRAAPRAAIPRLPLLAGLLLLAPLPAPAPAPGAAFAPFAGAQNEPAMTLAVEALDAPLAAPGGRASLGVVVALRCGVLAPSPAAAVEVELRVSAAPAWVAASLDPPTLAVETVPCRPGERLVRESRLAVAVLPEAPGLVEGRVELAAEADTMEGRAIAESGVVVRADYVGVLRLRAEHDKYPARAGESVRVAVEVENLGNAETLVSFETVASPPGFALSPLAPATLGVAPGRDPPPSRTLALDVRIPEPWPAARVGESVTLRATPRLADAPARSGAPSEITIAFADDSPRGASLAPSTLSEAAALATWLGVAAAAALLAALVLVLASRRRKRRA